jgi:SdpC family antimicrobial peptide
MNKRVSLFVAVGVVATLSAALALPANAETSQPARTTASVESPYSPEALFRGVYFLQGAVGEAITSKSTFLDVPGFAEAVEALKAEDSQIFVDEIVGDVRGSASNALVDWSREITSGDPFRVDAAFERGNELINSTDAIKAIQLRSSDTYVPGETGTDCLVATVVAAGFVLVVGAIAAAVVVMFEAGALGYNLAVAQNAVAVRRASPGEDTSQQREEWVALVTERLSV